MTEPSDKRTGPKHSTRVQEEKASRQARLAAEMRKNLLKRKAQQRTHGGVKPDQGRD
jgi:hypothetical protein